ncbi:DUF4097 family beta strand repeat-containing protein [Streptomyces hesseae]|uniref:DUF4097 family beta strand repeat-containing protein n=1 Tax=Streptomyces hesseae TaxID=3075519 RepID=A0ABU2SRS0_9ACTN|nr:DUF4097 family beta strand repeat-containing protein [Streptomyces sp. DSM 40473]MDT0451689.1 DUF4097 family beta strand repeat-containing protein [Streptomyces sp. DSM 40473]
MNARVRRAVRVSALAGGALVAATVLTGCGTANAEDATPEDRTFSISGKQLTVDSDNSAIELVPVAKDGKDIKVTRWFDGWTLGGSAGVSWEMRGDTLKLRLKCSGISVGCEAKHRIEVPRGVSVKVDDSNGEIKASGFETPLTLTSGNGRIDVRDSNGALELETSNGEIIADGVGAPRVKARSSNGRIAISATKAPESIDAETDNGGIRVTLPRTGYKVDARSDSGGAKVGVPRDDASGHSVRAHSSNGEVDIRAVG